MTRDAVLVLSRWTGFCLPCGSSDRPLVLVWTGRSGLRTRLLGPEAGTGELRLTCALCGGVDVVGWEDEAVDEALLRADDPVVVRDDLAVVPTAQEQVPAGVAAVVPELPTELPAEVPAEVPAELPAEALPVAVAPQTAEPADLGLDLLGVVLAQQEAPALLPVVEAVPVVEAPAAELPVELPVAAPVAVEVAVEPVLLAEPVVLAEPTVVVEPVPAAEPLLLAPPAAEYVPSLSADVAAALRELAGAGGLPAPRSDADLAALELLDRA